MQLVPWLARATCCFALLQGSHMLHAATSSNFTFNGSSSDMAQQFRNLYDVQYTAPALSLSSIPDNVTSRLKNYSLTFEDLPPLLQRAVLWDSGYVATNGDDTKLSTIYTMCNNATTMADIALSLAQYQKPGCVARNCTDPSDDSTATYRSIYCTGTQMLSVSVCAATDAGKEMDVSMWATGGNNALLPVPNMGTHKWTDSNTGAHYLVYAIHMVSPEHPYSSCPTQSSDNAMVIPCVPYANVSNTADWCRPKPSKLVDDWLAEIPASNSSSTVTSTLMPSTVAPSTGKSPSSAKSIPRTPPSLSTVLQSFVRFAPQYNGTSSDLALQYLVRYAEGDVVTSLPYKTNELPDDIQANLSSLGLKFEDLNGFLQRALIWDSGYAVAAGENKFIKIYTKSGRTMANIALTQTEYINGGCDVRTCADQNGGYSNRSYLCNGDQMRAMVHCATMDAAGTEVHMSMWANGGTLTDIPVPQVVRHFWSDGGKDYLIYAIHTVDQVHEPAWNSCIAGNNDYYGAMIVPCRPYTNLSGSTLTDWAAPSTSALVAAWLQLAQDSQSSFKWWYILLILLGVFAAVFVVVLVWKRYKRQAASTSAGQTQEMQVLSPVNRDVSAMNYNYAGLTDTNATSSVDRTITKGSAGSMLERGSASDAIRRLQEDPALVRSRIPLEELQFTRVLAKGGFGEVWMGHHQLTPVAIKKLLSTKQEFGSVQGFIEEIKLTSSLNHPNIIRFVGVAWTKLENICMVIEYLEKGDLQTFLESSNRTLTWNKEKYPIALGVASAISYLHARSPAPLIHRDIKAKNILLTLTLEPKLIDFGVSRDRVQETMTAGIGTPYWAAPEVLEGNRYTEQSDIYSFGILLSELDTGETPFGNVRSSGGDRLSAFQILNLVLAGKLEPELSPHCPPVVATIMQDCLRLDPFRRPTALQLVERLQNIMFSSQSIEPPPPYSSHGGTAS